MAHFALLILAISQITIGFGGPPCKGLEDARKRTYGFRPTLLKPAELKAKIAAMDDFWTYAKQLGPTGVTCVQTMLKDEKDDGFFLFDGGALLYSLDQSEASTSAVQDAVLRSDFNELDPTGYIRLVLNLSHHGAHIGPLALKFLTASKVDAFVPQHAMTLDRVSGGTILFGSMPASEVDQTLPAALSSGAADVRDSAALLLAFNMTEESFKTLKTSGVMPRLSVRARKEIEDFTRYHPLDHMPPPQFSREDVLRIIRRFPHSKEEYDALQPEYTRYMEGERAKHDYKNLQGKALSNEITREIEEGEPFWGISGARRFQESAIQTLTEADLPELREERRKSIQGVSDEALYEFFDYTRVMLGLINRLDLYKDLRTH